jgi:hypothetical protein
MRAWREWILVVVLGGTVQAETWQVQRIVGLEYPRWAQISGLEGSVEIECYIRNDGVVIRAERISGNDDLASIAIRNALRWKFRRVGSGDATYTLTYSFQIDSSRRLRRFRFVAPRQVLVSVEPVLPE